MSPVQTGIESTFDVTASGSGPLEYSWSFGDGTPATDFVATSSAKHQYATAGRYVISVTVRNALESQSLASTQAVYDAPTPVPPASDSTIIYDATSDLVWNVNPDNDSVTVIDAPAQLLKEAEIGVGDHPVSLANAGAEIWVTARKRGAYRSYRRGYARGGRPNRSPDRLPPPMAWSYPCRPTAPTSRSRRWVRSRCSTWHRRARLVVTAPPGRCGTWPSITRAYICMQRVSSHPPLPGEGTDSPQTIRAGNPVGGELLVIDAATGNVLTNRCLAREFCQRVRTFRARVTELPARPGYRT